MVLPRVPLTVLFLLNIDSTKVDKEGQVSRNQTVFKQRVALHALIDVLEVPRRYIGYE